MGRIVLPILFELCNELVLWVLFSSIGLFPSALLSVRPLVLVSCGKRPNGA